jgi:NRPS condensation-like uncharacterized protein
MNPAEFLALLRRQGVQVRVEGEQLKVTAPKGVLTAQLKEELAGRKPELLAELRGTLSVPLKRIDRSGELPLSFLQEGLWWMARVEPDNPVNHVAQAIRIHGDLDVEALRQSFAEVVRRHEILRTSVRTVNAKPRVQIKRDVSVSLPVVELRHLPSPERDEEVLCRAKEHTRAPFDLAQPPLLRTTLLRLGEFDHVFLLATHQFVVDGYSMRVLGQEVAAFYRRFRGEPASLSPLPVQYLDFAHWQREQADNEEAQADLTYWKHRLADLPAPLALPADRSGPVSRTPPAATRTLTLSAALSDDLRALSRREGVTLFMTFLAALKTLLHRYTQQEDIVVGTTVSLRGALELEGLIGAFGNNLFLRTDLSGNPSFKDLLVRVRTTALEAYSHQNLPFEKLVRELPPRQGMTSAPLFGVMFALHEFNLEQMLPLPGVTLLPVEADATIARVDLYLTVLDGAGELIVKLTYNTERFDATTIDRMMGHLKTLLAGVVHDADVPIGELPLLTADERRQLLVEFNASAPPLDIASIQQLFEKQAARAHAAIALVCGGREYSYADVNQFANRLAHWLRRFGVGPNVPVGLYLPAPVEMVVGMLAILKAGGACVVLDPNLPDETLHDLLRSTQAPILLTNQQALPRLLVGEEETFKGHRVRILCPEAGAALLQES